VEIEIGQRGGDINEKPSVPKSLEGLRKLLCELYQLFSSFLRGASRPKSPRDAAITAVLFMEQAVRVVKDKVGGAAPCNIIAVSCVQLSE
jgi:hypothetical protein